VGKAAVNDRFRITSTWSSEPRITLNALKASISNDIVFLRHFDSMNDFCLISKMGQGATEDLGSDLTSISKMISQIWPSIRAVGGNEQAYKWLIHQCIQPWLDVLDTECQQREQQAEQLVHRLLDTCEHARIVEHYQQPVDAVRHKMNQWRISGTNEFTRGTCLPKTMLSSLNIPGEILLAQILDRMQQQFEQLRDITSVILVILKIVMNTLVRAETLEFIESRMGYLLRKQAQKVIGQIPRGMFL
jgi:hypothetical protein